MARRRNTPDLNLAPELPEIRSSDFNLFYKPDVAPVDKSVQVFAKSLESFAKGALTSMALNEEKKEKETNEAEAIKSYNENKIAFSKAVEKGQIPKEANPYFIEKYKELELNTKAEQFKQKVFTEYASKNVLENPDPDAFGKFYTDELKKFVAENNLGVYDPVQLENGFFTKTAGTRSQLLQTHVSSQMSKIGEDFNLRYKENIQVFFDKTQSIEQIGANVTNFIKGSNGVVSNSTARKLLLESLTEYASGTGDVEFAQKLLRELPKNIKLGTDVLFNVKALENDFNAIKEAIDDRVVQKQDDEIKIKQNANTLENFDVIDYANEFSTLSEAQADERFKSFSFSKQEKIKDKFKAREVGFGAKNDINVDKDIDKLLRESKYDDALKLLDKSIPKIKESYYNKKLEEIKSFKFTDKDGLLSDDGFEFYQGALTQLAEQGAKNQKFGSYDTLIGQKYENKVRKWLKDNPIKNYASQTEREEAFKAYTKKLYFEEKDKLLEANKITTTDGKVTVEGENNTTPIIVNKEDL